MLYIENKWELNLYLEKNVWFKFDLKKECEELSSVFIL